MDVLIDKWKNLWRERQIWINRGMNKDIDIWKKDRCINGKKY